MSKRIALVLKYLDEEYQASIFRGVTKEAIRLGLEVICIQGDIFDKSFSETSYFFSSCSALNFDGILFLSSLLINKQNVSFFSNLLAVRRRIPIVSIGAEINSIPSIISEIKQPMNKLIDHLVDFHGYRKFLYLGGPATNLENQNRELLIRKKLEQKEHKKAGCFLTVLNGDAFSEHAGINLISIYFSKHPICDVDVIIAGSDNMATGILKFLKSSYTKEWRNCPISGFDDIPLAASAPLELTTIRQQTEQMGAIAVSTLDLMIKGKNVPLVKHIESQFIIRNSCGCSNYKSSNKTNKTGILLRREQCLRDTSYFGQEIMKATSNSKILKSLAEFLTNVGIQEYSLILYKNPTTSIPEDGSLIFQTQPPFKTNFLPNNTPKKLKNIFTFLLSNPINSKNPRCLYPLQSGKYQLGFMLYSIDQTAQPFMSISGMFLSDAFNRLFEIKKEQNKAQELENKIKQRTKELETEAMRRRDVEKEVLRISDLERLRFSLDLHDDICQRLVAMTFICKNTANTDKNMKILLEMACETLQKTQQYAHDSFPIEINSIDISEALNRLCTKISESNNITITFQQKGRQTSLSQEQKINIVRITQEALQNVLKHAHASKANVQLNYMEDFLYLTISDNGDGYKKQKNKTRILNNRRPQGLGIRSMEYRAHQLGGTFSITSSEKKGTIIQVDVPIKANTL